MKKISLFLLVAMLASCTKTVTTSPQVALSDNLKISSSVGIAVQTPFVTTSVSMNVKSDVAQTVTIKITDIGNNVVSKENVTVATGDNILKIYTSALPTAAYRIALYDTNGKLLGITDFNKI
jgi:hypothetical protein